MKKTYICPQIEEIQLKANQTLLAGSIQNNAAEDTYTISGIGDHQEGDVDI